MSDSNDDGGVLFLKDLIPNKEEIEAMSTALLPQSLEDLATWLERSRTGARREVAETFTEIASDIRQVAVVIREGGGPNAVRDEATRLAHRADQEQEGPVKETLQVVSDYLRALCP